MIMKAITVNGPNDITMDNVSIRALKEDEVLIKVAYAGICATDLAIYTGETDFVRKGLITYPCRIGHEWSGVVEAIGKSVTKFKKGDNVVTDNGVSCGECTMCTEGKYFECTNLKSVGTINCWDGCFAEYMIMPQRHTYSISPSLSLKEAALAEPLSISLASVKKYSVDKSTTVAIIGTGAIGLGSAALCSKLGANKIIVIGRTEYKLQKAKECGATHIINSRKENVYKSIYEITNNQGVDFVIETSGGKETVMQSIDIVKAKGTVALAAFYEKTISNFNVDTLVQKQVEVKGVMGEFGLVPAACRILEDGLPVTGIITQCIEFDNVPEYFRKAHETSKERIKVLVKVSNI
jgi:L-iditol 2-dehydrogenase